MVQQVTDSELSLLWLRLLLFFGFGPSPVNFRELLQAVGAAGGGGGIYKLNILIATADFYWHQVRRIVVEINNRFNTEILYSKQVNINIDDMGKYKIFFKKAGSLTSKSLQENPQTEN